MKNLALFITALSLVSAARAEGWKGFYGGVNAGGARVGVHAGTSIIEGGDYFTSSDYEQVSDAGDKEFHQFPPLVGGQLGYNFSREGEPELVQGLEADLQSMRVRVSGYKTVDSENFPGSHLTVGHSVSATWLATLRARLGLNLEDKTLAYVTAGAAATRIDYSGYYADDIAQVYSAASFRRTKIGWTVGLGAERRLARRLSIKGEYLFVHFDSVSSDDTMQGAPVAQPAVFRRSAGLNVNLLRVGLNCRLF